MIHEPRMYRAVPRKVPELLARFKKSTLPLCEKHIIRRAGFWATLIGERNHEPVCLVEWNDLSDRECIWNEFLANPERKEIRAETECDGGIVANIANSILAPPSVSRLR